MTFQTRFKLLILVFLLLVCIWFIGFIFFIFYSPQENCSDNQVDAVVVLTGGKNRIEEAIKLFNSSGAKKILISGIGKGVIKNDFFNLADKYKVPREYIVLGNLAENTFSNAVEAEIFMKLQGYKSLCLVTSNYHLPRSFKIFKDMMPEIRINYYPIFTPLDNNSSLAVKLRFLKRTMLEYNKYLACYAIYYFDLLSDKYYELLYKYLP
ncbi:YdcF family protein [Candidatus Jidaibacter acanthamoebae]|jgi:uncharacterized SAM-binding protein YcdF (DUF218 family)|nr:YdcF family protein [Candidatus Jidaibacter acanthamoeba]